MPGRAATGAPGVAGRDCESLAARSGRGGTTGRTAGWPASPGRAAALRIGAGGAGARGVCPAGAVDRAVNEGAVPLPMRTGSGGRTPPGIGCRGPDRIWPGLGADGIGLAGGAIGRLATLGVAGGAGAGAPGAPGAGDVASGGRKRCGGGATRGGIFSSTAGSCAASGCRAVSGAGACGTSARSGLAAGSSTTAVAAPFELAVCGCSAPPGPKMRRNLSATSSSTELE
ncbi:MAG: hypothetical protein JWO48_2738 [Bryobacterales bacterium]|nr:hypothetical protein [Bryobacterales bacterium]